MLAEWLKAEGATQVLNKARIGECMASRGIKRGRGKALLMLSLLIFAALSTIFPFTIVVEHAYADDLVLEKSAQTPLLAGAGVDTARTLNLLKQQTEKNGTTRIIVGLRVAFTPEGRLTVAAAAQQRQEIARLQEAVLEKIPSLKQRPESIKRFAYSPYMALEVNAAELDALAGLAEIAAIEADGLDAPSIGIEVVTPESK